MSTVDKKPTIPAWQAWFLRQHQQLTQGWQARALRERRIVVLGLVVVLATVLWLVAVRPALNTLTQARTALPGLRIDAATVSAIALEAQALKSRTTAMPANSTSSPIHLAQLQAAIEQAGLAPHISVTTAQSSVPATFHMQIEQASAATLLDWLARGPATLGLQIQTLDLHRSVEQGRERPGQVSGQLVLHPRPQP